MRYSLTQTTSSFNTMNEKWLGKKLRQRFQRIKLYNFEHCGVLGCPDNFGIAGPGLEFWLELKTIKNTHSKIPWQPSQPAWINSYLKHGGKVFTGLISSNTIYFLKLKLNHPEIFTDPVVRLIPNFCVSLTSLSEMPNGFRTSRWERIEEALLKALGKS